MLEAKMMFDDYQMNIRLALINEIDGCRYVIPKVKDLEKVDRGECIKEPTIELRREEAIHFLRSCKELYEQLVGSYSDERALKDIMKAKDYHLEDMRSLVFCSKNKV